MLTPLERAIRTWRPREGAAPKEDPVALLGAAWSDLVGEEIARNSRPMRITEGTLHVATRSGAWSQQLGFLADRVIAKVCARLPHAEIGRLRFRVGVLGPPNGASRPPRVAKGPRRVAARRPPAASAAEAVERFRDDVNQRQRAKRAAGWKECHACGALIAPDGASRCATCENARVQERAATVARLLFEAPWLGYAGTAALIDGLTRREYDAVRGHLLTRWWETLARAGAAKRLSRDGRERSIASSYVVLKSQLPPEAIRSATIRNVLPDGLYELIYETEEQSETNV